MKLKDLYENFKLKKNDVEHRQYEIKETDRVQYVTIDDELTFVANDFVDDREEYNQFIDSFIPYITSNGKRNTELLIKNLNDYHHLIYDFNHNSFIKKITFNYGGYSDWYIPSYQEMLLHKDIKGIYLTSSFFVGETGFIYMKLSDGNAERDVCFDIILIRDK